MANSKEEQNSRLVNRRKSNEERGVITLTAHIGMHLFFAIKDGKLYWKRDKQSVTLNDLSMIPGYDITEMYIKSFYVDNEKDYSKNNKEEQISSEIVARMNDGIKNLMSINLSRKILMGESIPDNKKANESIYNNYSNYLNNLLLENVAKGRNHEGCVVKNLKNDHQTDTEDYYIVCQYNNDDDTYELLWVYDATNQKFFVDKLHDVPSQDIDFSTATEAEEEFRKAVTNSTNTIFGAPTENGINIFIEKAVNSYNSIPHVEDQTVTQKQQTDADSNEKFETDDIYAGTSPEMYKYIFTIKKPTVIEIMSVNFKFEKDIDLNKFTDEDKFKHGKFVITGKMLANTMIEQLQARETHISINGNTRLRPADVFGFLQCILPNIALQFEVGNSNSFKSALKRGYNATIGVMSDENREERSKYNNRWEFPWNKSNDSNNNNSSNSNSNSNNNSNNSNNNGTTTP